MGILTQQEANQADALKVKIIDALWAAENTAIDETSWERERGNLRCIHKYLWEAFNILGLNPINVADQNQSYPFSENGDPGK